MNEVTIFNSPQFGQIRTLTIDGEPWFVGKDVAKALGYADTFGALKKHVDDDDKQNCQIDSFESNRGMLVINESGLYSLIMSSKLPEAKKFKRWVTSEVLPAIRKTGGYLGGNIEDIITKTVTAAVTAAMSELMKQIVPLVTAAVAEAVKPSKTIEKPVQLTFSAVQESAPIDNETRIIGVVKKRYKQTVPQKIVCLPESVKKCVDDMIISGNFSLSQIAQYIGNATDCTVTPATVHNYRKRYFLMPESGDEIVSYEQITMK